MHEVTYTNYTNGSTSFRRGYEPGDRLIEGWSGSITVDPTDDAYAIAERLFVRHNRDDRPDGQLCPSMSIGDVVVFAETALTVEDVGFRAVGIDRSDIVTDLTWREWVAQS